MTQTDSDLIRAINDVSQGCPLKQQTIDFMSTVSRPLENQNTVKLFSKRDLVDAYNRKQIMSMPGEIYEFDEEFNNIMSSIGLDEVSDDLQLPQKFDISLTLKQCLTKCASQTSAARGE
ncbi:hypothetical protein DPMN_005200 [Dreissena polymorpha]|uniref:Uncharacterized protein n=1 Tax=Dreissena polymorpha TaxID=45954 RepID=A0A9D4MS87_DREPO|nr:hypothetical protein DPMN_005200 [Dreissena polymorpha]